MRHTITLCHPGQEIHDSASDSKALDNMKVKPVYVPQLIDLSGKEKKRIHHHQINTKKKDNHESIENLLMLNKPTGVKEYQVKPIFNTNTKNRLNHTQIRYDVPHYKEQQINRRIRKPLLQKAASEKNIGGYYFKCFRTFLRNLLPFNF